MTRFLSTILLLITAVVAVRADYSVRSVSGNVLIQKSGKQTAATAGAKLGSNDVLILERGAKLEIFDSKDSQIYTADAPGQFTVTRIIFDARKKARSNSSAVHGKLRVTKDNKAEGVVYIEKGKVTRSLAIYDPEAQNIQIDTDRLSRRLYTMLRNDSAMGAASDPGAIVLNQRIDPDGLAFMVQNSTEHPVYFNVFKINAENGSVTISELGQPVGCYAILPTQFLAREQGTGLNPSELHILIMTDFYFDIDELLGKLNALIDSKPEINEPESTPLYLLPL